jgi:alcohol dehydrogenase
VQPQSFVVASDPASSTLSLIGLLTKKDVPQSIGAFQKFPALDGNIPVKGQDMSDIVFKIDPEIIVGVDTINRTGIMCKDLCKRVLIVTERVLCENKSIERLTTILGDAGVESIVFDEVPAQSTADVAQNAATIAHSARCELIIGFGGLKTQSIARVASVLAGSDIDIFELLDGNDPETALVHFVSIPTTGRDPFIFTNYCIVTDPRDRSVKQVKCPKGLCAGAVFDGGLAETVKGTVASAIVFDGFSTAVEAYCSRKSNILSDALLEQSIALYIKMLHAYRDQQDMNIAETVTNASLLMALGITTSAPGPGLALTYSLNSRFPISKSVCSTILLPYVLEKLVNNRPQKIANIAGMMGENTEGASVADTAQSAVDAVRRYQTDLHLPTRLKDYNLSLDRLTSVAEAARNMEFVAFSPWIVTTEDAFELLKQAF